MSTRHTLYLHYADMKYKHKYEHAVYPSPNGMSSDTFLKKYTKYWPPACKLKLIRRPLWSTLRKMLQSTFKINLTLAFWSKLFSMYWNSENSKQRYLLSDGTVLIWPKSLFYNSLVYLSKQKEPPHTFDFKLSDDMSVNLQYFIKWATMFSVKQETLK